MPFWAYLLHCSDGSYYAGHSDALEHRIGQHQMGRGSDYTARRQPVTFVWCQEFPTRLEALEAERRIKGWSRAKKEALIAGDWERVSQLAVAYSARPSTSSGRTEKGVPITLQSEGAGNRRPSLPVRPEPVEGHAPNTEARTCP